MVSYLVLQTSCGGRESRLLYFNCVLAVMWLLVLDVPPPRGDVGWSVAYACVTSLAFNICFVCLKV